MIKNNIVICSNLISLRKNVKNLNEVDNGNHFFVTLLNYYYFQPHHLLNLLFHQFLKKLLLVIQLV